MKYTIYEDGGTIEGNVVIDGLTLEGPLRLNKYPEALNEAVNKEYVDSLAVNITAAGITRGVMSEERFPAFEGDLVAGAGTGIIEFAPSGVTPGSYTKVTVGRGGNVISGESLNAADIPTFGWGKVKTDTLPSTLAGYGITNGLNKDFGTVEGNLKSPVHPTMPEDAVTKQYLEGKLGNLKSYSVGDIVGGEWLTPPAGFLTCNGGMLNKSTYPELYNVVGDSFENTRYDAGSGRPWNNFKESTAIVPVGSPGFTFSRMSASFNSPGGVARNGSCFLLKDFLYQGVPGGSFYVNTLNNSSGYLGTWSVSPVPMPVASGKISFLVTKNKLFLFSETGQFYQSPVNSDGTIGNFTPIEYQIPASIKLYTLPVLFKGNIYVFDLVGSSYYISRVNKNGDLGNWNKKQLPIPLPYSVNDETNSFTLPEAICFSAFGKIIVFTTNVNGELVFKNEQLLQNHYLGITAVIGNVLLGVSRQSDAVVKIVFSPSGEFLSMVYFNNLPNVSTSVPAQVMNGSIILVKNYIYIMGPFDSSGSMYPDGKRNYVVSLANAGSNDYSQYYDGSLVITDPLKFQLPEVANNGNMSTNYFIKY